MPDPPFRLDQFEVRRLIGRGGQGFVYEAFDHDLDRSAALKIVISRDEGRVALSRFEQEGKSLARLKHPNIVTIYTSKSTTMFGDAPARYFAMEYLPAAMPITEHAAHHKLPIHRRVDLIRSLCLALEAGHRKGVFHRDIKPPNLLVDNRDVPRVIDFGLAAGPSVRDDAQRARIRHGGRHPLLHVAGAVQRRPGPHRRAERYLRHGGRALRVAHGAAALPRARQALAGGRGDRPRAKARSGPEVPRGPRPAPGRDRREGAAEGTARALHLDAGVRRRPGAVAGGRSPDRVHARPGVAISVGGAAAGGRQAQARGCVLCCRAPCCFPTA
ncbi:MAG: protein kinase [Planctomycetota bacterium]|nr:MAG: protein kinase [Planctomycetota bacterium]